MCALLTDFPVDGYVCGWCSAARGIWSAVAISGRWRRCWPVRRRPPFRSWPSGCSRVARCLRRLRCRPGHHLLRSRREWIPHRRHGTCAPRRRLGTGGIAAAPAGSSPGSRGRRCPGSRGASCSRNCAATVRPPGIYCSCVWMGVWLWFVGVGMCVMHVCNA